MIKKILNKILPKKKKIEEESYRPMNLFPIARKVVSKTIAFDLISVQPSTPLIIDIHKVFNPELYVTNKDIDCIFESNKIGSKKTDL